MDKLVVDIFIVVAMMSEPGKPISVKVDNQGLVAHY